MYLFRSSCYSKHGYPVKMYQCRYENFRRLFNIVREIEGSGKSQKECFDLRFDYMHFNKSRSLFVKSRAYQNNFVGARTVKHAATPKSVENNFKSGENGNQEGCQPPCASGRTEKKKIRCIFPENPSFDRWLTTGVDKIEKSFQDSFVPDTETLPLTSSDLDSTGYTSSNDELSQDYKIDRALYKILLHSRASPHFIKIAEITKNLPIYQIKNEFLNLLDNNQVVIVTGSTGCGKSTQLVQYVLDDFILSRKGSLCNIICIVPRRVCATSLAARISYERQDTHNYSIGYKVRLNSKLSIQKRGCINFLTTGIMLDMLKKGECLSHFSHIFIDEVHERSMESDMILAMLKKRLNEIPNTKIVLMSATMNSSIFSEYMGGAPHIEAPGFQYPVEEYYLEDILKEIKFTFGNKKFEPLDKDFTARVLPYVRSLNGSYPGDVITELSKPISEVINYKLMAKVIEHILNKGEHGSILMFLPGINEIMLMNGMLLGQPWYSENKIKIKWMHSYLTKEEQEKIFELTPKGTWKIIISTSILETSVTFTDVKYIIDTGRMQMQSFNFDMNVNELKPVWISLSNARQRKGRAGRVQEGVCIKLYTRAREQCFSDYPIPESRSCTVEQPFVMAECGKSGCAREFLASLLDPPETAVVDASAKRLQEMDVLDSEEKLTPLGKYVANIPFPSQLSKLLLLGAIFRCFEPVASIASVLTEKNIFPLYGVKKKDVFAVKMRYDENDLSDHLICSRIIRKWQLSTDRNTFADVNMLSSVALNYNSLMMTMCGQVLHRMNFLPSPEFDAMDNNTYSGNKNLVKALLCWGFYPKIAFQTSLSDKHRLKSWGSHPIRFGSTSICSTSYGNESPFFVYFKQILKDAVFISDATMVNPLPVILFCKNLSLLGSHGHSISIIGIDNITKVRIPNETYHAVLKFRKCLRRILDHSCRNPDALNELHSMVIPDLVDLLSLQDLKFSM